MSDALDGPTATRHELVRPALFTGLIALLWLLPGLLGHDPWRPEALSIGLVSHIVQSGDWVVPAIAGVPESDAFPLYHVTAAIIGRALDAITPLHDAARLASGLYMALAFVFVALATRELLGERDAWLAPLALMGCIGLVAPAHGLSPDSAQVAAFALALYGLALAPRRALGGGIALGCGVGAGFLSNGLLAPLAFALSVAVLPLVSPSWRSRRLFVALVCAAIVLVPWLAVWPALLHAASPEAFAAWWEQTGTARFTAPLRHVPVTLAYFLGVLPWFAFPALPLAIWAVWARRREAQTRPAFALCIVLAVSTLALLALDAGARQRDALPLLVPLAVLAVAGMHALRRSPANAFWWFSILFGSIMVLMGWFEWSALELGFPAARQRHWIRQQPAYVPDVEAITLFLALVITAIWVGVIKLAGNRRERPLMAWSGGVAVVWALALAMFLDYADLEKSYRPVAEAVATAARGAPCVGARDLAQSQQVLISYLSGLALRAERDGTGCDLLLVQGQRNAIHTPDAGWQPLWEGSRSGERRELFRLYRRQP
ncbi:MAG: glycosyltransferase family 39 protein [Burkholderiales bacterium]|nr:glycosyltransferase family 39 protein [Burkholderiales bacterium]